MADHCIEVLVYRLIPIFSLVLISAACGSVDSKPPVANNGSANNGASNNGSSNNGASNNGSSNNGNPNNGTPNNGSTNNMPVNNGTLPGDVLFPVDGDGVLSGDEIAEGCRAAEACSLEEFNEQFATVEECISGTEQQIEESVLAFGEECAEETNAFLECSLGASRCVEGDLGRNEAAAETCEEIFAATGCSS